MKSKQHTQSAAGQTRSEDHGASVTQGVLVTGPTTSQLLLLGIDTLDLTAYVNWGDWQTLGEQLRLGQSSARKTSGVVLDIGAAGKFIMSPGGGMISYSYHLSCDCCELFIKDVQQPNGLPNLFISIHAHTLRQEGLIGAVGQVKTLVENMGGRVVGGLQPSRVDLSADFNIPGGLNLDFLQSHKVCCSRLTHPYLDIDRDKLISFYVGAKSAPVQLRLYAKGRQVMAKPDQRWLKELWGITDIKDVWRVEFQIRREVLRDRRINTIEDLSENLGGVWHYLTHEWFSLRLPDNNHTSRRTVHPLWAYVQDSSQYFGPNSPIPPRRPKGGGGPSVQWHIEQMAGCVESFAALKRISTPEAAMAAMNIELTTHWQSRDFHKKVFDKSIKQGIIPPDAAEPRAKLDI